MSKAKSSQSGHYTMHLDNEDEGRLTEIAAYYSIPHVEAIQAVVHRGLASILIQLRQEKEQTRRRHISSNQIPLDD